MRTKFLAITMIAVATLATILTPIGADIAEAQGTKEVQTWAIDVHGNGSQLIVTEVTVNEGSTSVKFEVINGRDFGTHFNAATSDTRLEDDQGRTYKLLKHFSTSIEPGHSATITLVFEKLAVDAESVSFYFRDRDGDDNDVTEGFPSFVIADLDLTKDTPTPLLPNDIDVEESDTHPNGASLTIETIEFVETGITVEFEAKNPSERRIDLSNGRHASFIEDDLGNRYWLKLGDSGPFFRLDQNRRVSGTLLFAGRIHPDATSIELVMNHDESASDARSTLPKFELGPFTIGEGRTASTGAGDLLPLEIGESQRHANGLEVTIDRLVFVDGGTGLEFEAQNGDQLSFLNGCCKHTYLLDDLGNQYILRRPSDNTSVRVRRNSGVTGEVFFIGEIDSEATELTLVFNDRDEDSLDDSETIYPELRFGPYELERSDAGASLVDIAEQFDAIALRSAVQFTVSADDLFEPGTDDLDKGTTFDELVRLLDYYSGEPLVIVAHTDSDGTSSANRRLSEQQAGELRDALVDAGYPSDAVEIEGEGEDDPIEEDDTEAGRQANRRIEIVVTTRMGLPS